MWRVNCLESYEAIDSNHINDRGRATGSVRDCEKGYVYGTATKALDKELDTAMAIQCDNQQTVGLLNKESAVLNTRLRHVDIHNH
jgi:hypothetical protein